MNVNSSLTGLSVYAWQGKVSYEQETLGTQPVWAKSPGKDLYGYMQACPAPVFGNTL